MPGPLPKDPSLRQRRNKKTSRALLHSSEFTRLRAPRLPDLSGDEQWHPLAREFWKTVWASPLRFEFLRADEPALFRLVFLVHKFWTSGSLAIATEIRMLEREFGLTPLSRRRLEWTVVQAEEAKDRHEQKRIQRAEIIDLDPRGALSE